MKLALAPVSGRKANFNTGKWVIKLENGLPLSRCLLGESDVPQDTGSIPRPWGYDVFIDSFQDHGRLNIAVQQP